MDHATLFSYQKIERIATQKFGSVDAFIKHLERSSPWWYKAKKAQSLKVRDLETIAAALGCSPTDFFLADSGSGTLSTILEGEISARVQQICATVCVNEADFAIKTGMEPGRYQAIINQSSSFALDDLIRILNAFPNLSAPWILQGIGSMIVQQPSDIEALRELVADKQRIIDLLSTDPNKTLEESDNK